jgi:hypothetical protein
MVFDLTPVCQNDHGGDWRLTRMKNLVCTSHAKERLEIARRHSILHLEPIVGNPEVIRLPPRDSCCEVGFSAEI